MKTLRLAVIGAGHLGRVHAKLLAEMPEVNLVGVADSSAAARDRVAADCRTTAYADYRDLIAKVDAAVIATPTRSHLAVALDFLRRGVSLLIEKPLTASLAEADELMAAAKQHQALIQVGHIERFNPAFVAAAEHATAPQFVEAIRSAGFTGRSTDVGVVYDLMVHDIELVLALVGSPVSSVTALGLAILGKHEDVAHARLDFENGCIANLSASRVSYAAAPKRQMQIWGAGSYTSIDFANRSASVVRPSADIVNRRVDFETLSMEEKTHVKERLFSDYLHVEPLAVESRNALADELRDFVDSVRRRRQPRVSGEQGREAVAVAEAILDSMRKHPWNGRKSDMGPLATPMPNVLRGPHWAVQPAHARREAS